jgi:chromatin segregation and condensation protein Rec8/ScpA/Scc1 (kleisin family)
MTDEQYRVHLPAYDGAGSVAGLIRKQEINIYDIPIARSRTVSRVCPHDGGVGHQRGGEFLLMAATLIYIKSKCCCQRIRCFQKATMATPSGIVARLLEHESSRMPPKCCIRKSRGKFNLDWLAFATGTRIEEERDSGDAFDLVSTFQEILERAKAKAQLEIERDEMTVGQVMEQLRGFFDQKRGR